MTIPTTTSSTITAAATTASKPVATLDGTLDGTPTPLSALNIGGGTALQPERRQRLVEFYKNLNLFMAGMYTGVRCGGTPHGHHTYPQDRKPPRT
ncbi:MAG: hypothetical protein EXR84_12415 [Gammaproteobacteria bacterium]|nr:hypothetical protein [Gammaproteobacteria bacterium]